MRIPIAMPLRRALLAGALGLTGLALLVAGAVSAVQLRSYLVDRTDEQLTSVTTLAAQREEALAKASALDVAAVRSAVAPTEYAVEFVRDGRTVRFSGAAELPVGAFLRAVPAPPPTGVPSAPVTVLGYRAVAVRTPTAELVVAQSLRPVDDTVARLVRVELVVGVLVMLVLGVLARAFVVRRLRPLDEVTATAAQIAAGRLDRRVPAHPAGPDPRTEVGRLTAAVNGMLARIQDALVAEQRSAERLRSFVADASHELRTPLTSIRGYVHLLRQGMVAPGEEGDALRRVDDEAARMAALVDDLLSLARWDAPRDRPLADVDLVPVLRESLADALAAGPGRPARLDVPDTCVVRGDEAGLRQVMANLLGNVRAHTPPDTPVSVTLRAEGGRVVVEVADRGPGMPPDVAGRAFERFVRGERPDPGRSAGQAPGSGLGLAIVDEIVAAHGGDVTLRSRPGEGTTVRIELPAGS